MGPEYNLTIVSGPPLNVELVLVRTLMGPEYNLTIVSGQDSSEWLQTYVPSAESMMLRSVVGAIIPEAIVIIPEMSLALAHSCLRSTSYEATL
jgi:hypothetical protein